MEHSPRSPNARLLDRGVVGRAFGFLGPVEAILAMAMLPIGAALFFGWPGEPLPSAGADKQFLSTMVFASIVAMEMANAFECRSNPASLFAIGPVSDRLLLGAVAIEASMLLAFVYVPPIRDLLGQQPLSALAWIPILVAPWVFMAAEETRKAIVRRPRRR